MEKIVDLGDVHTEMIVSWYHRERVVPFAPSGRHDRADSTLPSFATRHIEGRIPNSPVALCKLATTLAFAKRLNMSTLVKMNRLPYSIIRQIALPLVFGTQRHGELTVVASSTHRLHDLMDAGTAFH